MKILAKVSYLGTNYHGWQIQPNGLTIQEVIESTLSKILNTPTKIYGSGRTDAGVHALNQAFHFELNKDFDLERLKYSLNSLLPDDVSINSLEKIDDDFHARFSAKKKHYQYRINTLKKNPFLYQTTAYYPYPFDMTKFTQALDLFVGEHNYQNFTSKEEDEDSYKREIYDIKVTIEEDYISVNLIGSGFMRYMIRDIIGTCLAVASGKEELTYITDRLDTDKDMHTAYRASPEGLFLIDVIY
ncbi:MAG: tRNA pseudouridine(38-40) synthase TruA [Bacilli bacterium]|nr:tRNA pseudouridine(38-40) synthase TruA [Bacilli bacterium]